MISSIFFIIFICGAAGLTGYDCGTPQLNITTVSLIGTGTCDIEHKDIKTQNVYIQLLQLADFESTPYIQCKVIVTRTVSYCGMHSHVSAVHNGYEEYLREVPYQQCERMHRDGIMNVAGNNIIEHLKANTTSAHGILMAGTLNNDGTCKGGSYSDSFGSWDNVIVQGIYRITLKSGMISVKLNSGKVILRSGTICNLADSTCLDMEDGNTFWQTIPATFCNFNQYDVLYEGTAQKSMDKNLQNAPEIFSLTTKETTFALTKTTEFKLCGYTLYRTEHPKLFILETQAGNTFIKTKPIAVENLDIFTYVNSKFVYVEKHLKTQISTMYRDIMIQKCELEQQVISNALSLARIQPEEFAHKIMKEPGYTAVVAGEAAHIIKCIPIEVNFRPTEECYDELPVTYRNTSFFLQPKTHILRKTGTKRDCNQLLPVMYILEDIWIRFLPKPIDAPAPIVLKPKTALSWKYLSAGNLATSGIYSEADLQKLREHIMFPAEKPAMINNIVRGMSGKQALGDGMSIYNIMDEDTLNKLTESAAKKVWNGFITFGSASAGILAVFIIIRLVKIIFDTLLQGYALHSVYGCGIQLLGAIFTSLTQLLLHFAKSSNNKRAEENTEKQETTNEPVEMQPLQPTAPLPRNNEEPSFSFSYLNKRLQDVP